jgi:Protein of unknown function (DUF2800)
MPGQHSLLAPSSAERWINCPPSARATEHIEEVEQDYQVEGTLGHDLVKLYLVAWRDFGGSPPDYDLATLRSHRLWSQELEDASLEYVESIKLAYTAALARDASAQLRIERRVDLTHVSPEPFAGGTSDASILWCTTLEVHDAKFGRGVYVSAVDNEQCRMYALGLLKEFEDWWPITDIECHIHQPRLDSHTQDRLTRRELEEWGQNVVVPAARLAWEGRGQFKAGSWCQFCKIRATCTTRAEAAVEEAKVIFAAADGPTKATELTIEQVAAMLPKIAPLRAFLADLERHALTQGVAGVQVPGYKVVAGRSIRRYTDAASAAGALIAHGIPEALVFERSIASITALESSLGKAVVREVLSPYIEKPPGAPKLVPDTDSRPKIDRNAEAAAVFAQPNQPSGEASE